MTKNFDSLAFAEALMESGFPEPQAKGLAKAMWELIDSQLVTKADLAAFEERIMMAMEFKNKELRADLKLDLAALKEELTMRMVGILILQTGVTALLLKLLH